MAQLELTPTEQRIWNVLKDGLPHDLADLVACLPVSDSYSLHAHLNRLRGKLFDVGMNVVKVRKQWMLMQRIQQTPE